jgi:hypothetical protein
MAQTRKTERRTCKIPYSSVSVPLLSPRKAQTIVDTPRRVRLLRDIEATADKLLCKELFKAHNVSKSTGYYIIKSKTPRRSDHVHNQGQKSVLAPLNVKQLKQLKIAYFALKLLHITPLPA